MKHLPRVLVWSLLATILLLATACGDRNSSQDAGAAADYWPTDGWLTSSPERQGVDSALLKEAIEFLGTQQDLNIHSLLVIRNGYVIVDASYHPIGPNAKHDLASVTKSITSTVAGVAIEKGFLAGVDQPVLDLLPNRDVANLTQAKEALTIGDLLTMRTGLECVAEPGEPTLFEMMASDDWVQYTLDLPMSSEPGAAWSYCSSGVHLLSAAIQEAAGMTTLAFAEEHLFRPLGISKVVWPTGPNGVNRGWGDLKMTPHDLAKIGLLYLHDGVWESERLLPAGWVADATKDAALDYGYLWWLNSHGYYAQGRGGQRMFVVPEEDLVVVTTAGASNEQALTELLGSYVLPAIRSAEPLAEDHSAEALLAEAIRLAGLGSEVNPISIPPLSDRARGISAVEYVMEPNPAGLLSASLTLEEGSDVATLTYSINGANSDSIELFVGLDGVTRLSEGRFGMASAARGSWTADDTFSIDFDELGNLNRWQMTLVFQDAGIVIFMHDLLGGSPDFVIDGAVP